MRLLKIVTLLLFVLGVCSTPYLIYSVEGQGGVTEAPTGFDDKPNGTISQADFDAAKEVFAEQEEEDEGLGPVFNSFGCADCHAVPVVGGSSQIVELRAGHFNGVNFIDHPGGSLINQRAIDPAIIERVLPGFEVRTFRSSISLLGAGFVEAIDSNSILAVSNDQPASMRGQLIQVPVNEANNQVRAGRFGHKNQHASLISFAADAYLNEKGITSPLQPRENTSNGRSVVPFDEVEDPEDDGEDVRIFARFMRALKAPPRDTALANTAAARNGERIFNDIGCDTCHTPTFVTAPPGTVINRGAFTIPPALGNKRIHPFSDFLLHDIGTGDGIVQNGGQSTRNKVKTAALWGVRVRNQLMHDALSLTFNDAILRHGGQATGVTNRFRGLSNSQKNDLFAFLNSL